jgi:hypothetical protein
MEQFIERYPGVATGILHGFDRVLFRGTLRSISYLEGIKAFLAARRVLWKDFPAFAQRLTGILTR